MQFLHTVHCVIFNYLYNQHWNWYFFCLLQVHVSLVLKKDVICIKFGTRTQTTNY